MAYVISKAYSFTRLQKTFSSCKPKEEWPHAGLYNYKWKANRTLWYEMV